MLIKEVLITAFLQESSLNTAGQMYFDS